MREKLSAREKKLKRIQEVIRSRTDNIIHVDFVFLSMYEAIEDWYIKYCERDDPHGYVRKAHLFMLTRHYIDGNFKNHATLGEERDKLLIKLDDEMQLRRID